MGRTKSGLLERNKEGTELSKEAIDTGTEIKNEGTEIKRIMDGVDTTMDEDDVNRAEKVNDGYGKDFNEAFEERAEKTANQVSEIEKGVIDDSGEEKDKVEDAGDKYKQMEGVSDIGKENAREGADAMKKSASEYEEISNEAESIDEKCQEKIKALKGETGSIFG